MLIHPIKTIELYPIGSVIHAYAPPDYGEWVLCNGQELLQLEYPILYSLMDDPHPIFQHWEIIQNGMTEGLRQVVYDGSQYVGCSIDGYMGYSSDGATWTEVTLSSYTDDFFGLAYDGTTFVAIPDYFNLIDRYITSTDGQTWTERNLPTAIEGHAICHDGTNFYVVSYDDGYCLYSSDGTTWSSGTSLPDATFQGLAASSDKVVTITYGTPVLAVSDDAMTTWKLYTSPAASCREIFYDATDDIFVFVCGNEPVYGVSPGDDGIDWDIRHLSIPPKGNERGYNYGRQTFYKIKRAGSYWFALSWYSQQMAYSEDLITWKTFPCLYSEWYDVFYNSTSGYYYIVGYGGYSMRWKEVTNYDTGTYFKLPLANNLFDPHSETNKQKYIRIK